MRRRIAIVVATGLGIAVCVHWLNTPAVEVARFPDARGRYCWLQSKTSHFDIIPFEQILEVRDATGKPFLNGKWTADCYVESISWNGDTIDVWNASSICYWGVCYKGKVLWPSDVCSDQGLADLKGCEGVSGLYLSGRNITDAGLLNLRGLPNLKGVVLDTPRVTFAGVLRLKAAMPNLEIQSNLLRSREGRGATEPATTQPAELLR